MVLGARIDLSNVTEETSFTTLGGRTVKIRVSKDDGGKLKANDAVIIERKVEVRKQIQVLCTYNENKLC